MFSLIFSSWLPNSPNLIYFIVVDRFENGSVDNDYHVTEDLNDLQGFHGGDLQGIEAKLPYIQSLGADAIWLSPIFEMRTEKFHGHGAFHGYWVQNLERIEPSFGGEIALKSLSTTMQQQDIKLILDMVYNHVSFDSNMRNIHPDWFHLYPSISDWNDPIQLTHFQVHGLPDLNQNHPDVYDYLLHQSRYWIDFTDAYGLRIDAIRHMENDFLYRIHQDLPNAWFLGEDFQGNPTDLIQRGQETGFEALFDFPFYYAITETFCDDSNIQQLASILSLQSAFEQTSLVRFLDNHDLPRILSRCNNDPNKVNSALFFLLSSTGIPMLTYGTESGLQGDSEPENRSTMNWDHIDAHQIQLIQTMTSLRKKHPVMRDGISKIIDIDEQWMVVLSDLNQIAYQSEHVLQFVNLSTQPHDVSALLTQYCPHFKEGWQWNGQLHHLQSQALQIPAQSQQTWICSKYSQKEQMVTIQFSMSGTVHSQWFLVGSSPDFGGWHTENAVPLKYQNGIWTATLQLPAYQVHSYKILEYTHNEWHWENGDNRFLWTNTDKSISLR